MYLGYRPANSTVIVDFNASAAATGASITISGLAVTDIEVYKGTSMTQRASDNGYTLLDTDGIDIDGVTGIHGFSIDLSDNSDSGFWAAGSFYRVVVSAITVDGQTVSFTAARFDIGPIEANVSQFGGTAGTFSGGRPEVNASHAGGTAWGSGAITAGSIAADAITAAKLASDVATEINAAILAVLGALADAAADGDPTTTDTMMAYLKQIINTLEGTAGIPTFPSAAAPGNAVSLAEVLRSIYTQIGVAGAGLTDLGGMSTTMKGQVQTEAEDAIVAKGLDKLVVIVAGTIDNSLSDATTTVFKTDLESNPAGWENDAHNDLLLQITSGLLRGQTKPILDYAKTSGVITLAEALTGIPANGVTFTIFAIHVHPISQIQSGLSTHSAADVWAAATRTLTAIDEDSTTLDLDATIRAALGLASANLDTQLDAIPTVSEIWTTALTEAYRSTGATGTGAQLLYEILANIVEFSISGTTKTAKKLDGSTTAKTYTLDSSSAPTSITEAT